jgi:peptide/nickel transport system permease protein
MSLDTTATPARAKRRSRFGAAVRNNPIATIGLLFVALFVVSAAFPTLFASQDPTQLNLAARLKPPSLEHPFGTDHLGMDVFTRVVHGARTTMFIVIVVLGIAVTIGTVVGAIAGYLGGWVEEILMRITDVMLAFPFLVLAIAINAALGRGLWQTMVAVGLSWWPSYARLVRGQILSVKHNEYVVAATALGASRTRALLRHVVPNAFDPVLVRITLDVGFVALTTAGLSFLGLGAEPPTPEWGRMVAEGRDYLLTQWWITAFPGLALFVVVVGFNLLGIIIRDWLDPSGINR